MLDIIRKNPFRILGVYSNSKQTDIVRNIRKITAYLNVGKEIEFPSDISGLFSEPDRTIESLQQAQAAINLPNDKIRYALFWFCNADPIDQTGLNNIIVARDLGKAYEIFAKKDTYSSLINRAIISLIENDFPSAIAAYSTLIHNELFRTNLLTNICDDTFYISEEDLSHTIIDELIRVVKPKDLIQHINNEIDRTYIKQKAIEEPLTLINREIEKAKKVSPTDAPASLRAGRALIKVAQSTLATLHSLVGGNDIQYQSSADNLAKHILQCGINYYNNTDDDNDIANALAVQEYALSIAVSPIVKERCKTNVDILKQKKDRSVYEPHLDFIATELKSFQDAKPSISTARTLVNSCKPHLDILKAHLGVSDSFYLKVSSAVAGNALGMIVSDVNKEQSLKSIVYGYKDLYGNLRFHSSIDQMNYTRDIWFKVDSALNAMELIGKLDMNQEERTRYTTNLTTLNKIKNNLEPAIKSYQNSIKSHSSSSSNGCYIATMVYGDYDAPQVVTLREFRDMTLRKYTLGRLFIRFYYKYSPTWVEHLKDKKRFNMIIRRMLDKFISIYNHE